jgi:hypothetical protein
MMILKHSEPTALNLCAGTARDDVSVKWNEDVSGNKDDPSNPLLSPCWSKQTRGGG